MDLTWFQQARLRAIEAFAFWRGRINTRDVIEFFGVSRMIAQKDIHHYMELAPGNLVYRGDEKAYLATSIFKNYLTTGLIDEWLNLDSGLSEYVEKPQFQIDPKLTRPIIQAVRKGTGLTAIYRSMDHPEGIERSLFPHTFVYSGFRWHLRAWCCRRSEFRDFNLARFVRVNSSCVQWPDEASPENDKLWHHQVSIDLIANPKLSKQERTLIEAEFGMKRGRLRIKTRAALTMYTLQMYQVDPNTQNHNRKNRLVLSNKVEIEPFLW